MKKVYYRDEEEKTYLQEKYDDVDIEYLPIPADRKDARGPLVCNNDEPLDDCKVGEEYI